MALFNRIVIDCTKNGTSPTRYANRSCSPNPEYTEVKDERGSIVLFLTVSKRIRALEEVNLNYNFTDQNKSRVIEERVFRQCGSQNFHKALT